MKSKKTTALKKKSVKKHHVHDHAHDHPSHTVHLKQLARVKGQLEGIEKMINEGRYCVDIINQLKAVGAGVRVVESAIFNSHLKSCLKNAMASKDENEVSKKIDEIIKLVYGPKSKR